MLSNILSTAANIEDTRIVIFSITRIRPVEYMLGVPSNDRSPAQINVLGN
jgi:hypothetical protein